MKKIQSVKSPIKSISFKKKDPKSSYYEYTVEYYNGTYSKGKAYLNETIEINTSPPPPDIFDWEPNRLPKKESELYQSSEVIIRYSVEFDPKDLFIKKKTNNEKNAKGEHNDN